MGDKLDKALDSIFKKHGKESIVNGDETVKMERISTGSIGLDIITGGGYPEGRHALFVSLESCGKSTMCIHALVQALKKYPNKKVAIVDSEQTMDRGYCEALGLDMSKVIMCQPTHGEEALDIADTLIESGEISMIVIDSIATLTPKKELDGEIGDSVMGLQARMMSQAFRVLTSKANKTGTVVLWCNQQREKIGIVWGSPITEPGGNAAKYYVSIKIELKKKLSTELDEDGEIKNSKVTAKAVKNKTAPPFRECEYDIVFGEGIDVYSELLFYGEKMGIIKKSGSWFSYGNTKLAQGASNTKALLKDNPELAEEIEAKIRKHYKI